MIGPSLPYYKHLTESRIKEYERVRKLKSAGWSYGVPELPPARYWFDLPNNRWMFEFLKEPEKEMNNANRS